MHRVGDYGKAIYGPSKKGEMIPPVIGHKKHTRRCLSEQEMSAKGMQRNDKGWWTVGPFIFVPKASNSEQPPDEEEQTA